VAALCSHNLMQTLEDVLMNATEVMYMYLALAHTPFSISQYCCS